jgi:site-specific recombinase XerC
VGLRRAELVSLNIGDFDRGEQRLLMRGKRNKQRSLPVVASAAAALADWLAIRGAAPGALFWGTGNLHLGVDCRHSNWTSLRFVDTEIRYSVT